MPIRSAALREGTLASRISEMSRSRSVVAKAWSRQAIAASVA